jgi:hypothetical protein
VRKLLEVRQRTLALIGFPSVTGAAAGRRRPIPADATREPRCRHPSIALRNSPGGVEVIPLRAIHT